MQIDQDGYEGFLRTASIRLSIKNFVAPAATIEVINSVYSKNKSFRCKYRFKKPVVIVIVFVIMSCLSAVSYASFM